MFAMNSSSFNHHRLWIAFILLGSCFFAFGVLSRDTSRDRRSSSLQLASVASSNLSRYVDAINKMVNFFWRDRARTNVDALYGLRLAQGHFLRIFDDAASLKDSHPLLWHKLNIISRQLDRTLAEGVRVMHARNGEYDRVMGWVVQSVWIAEPLVYMLSMKDAVPLLKRKMFWFGERKSDQCMAEVIGTGRSRHACTFSSDCWKLMHNHLKRAQGYSLTHNSLYFFLARHRGCEKAVNEKLLASVRNSRNHLKSVKDVLAQSCANIYLEMVDASAYLPIPIGDDQDLFVEQGALCSFYGYPEVLQKRWVDLAVSWVTHFGCVKAEPARQRSARWTSRHLLADVELGNGCSEHTTTLALVYVTAYVRYELQKMMKPMQQSPASVRCGNSIGVGRQETWHWRSLIEQGAEHLRSLRDKVKYLQSLLSL